jgi:uncharacterized flavoprotein (TIGR03862 family)
MVSAPNSWSSVAAHPNAAVVGGGPAGLIAAEVLATNGVAVTVYDHKPSVGRKFLLAGRGGLNITHGEPFPDFVARYGPAADWLEPMLRRFGPADLRAWCAGLGEPTFVGSSGRVFPESFRATPLLRAWLGRLAELGVRFELRHRWLGWDDGGRSWFRRADGSEIDVAPDATVMALGGASWPRVGSDGGWVGPFAEAGVEVTALRPSNVGVRVDWTDGFADRFAGVPLKNVALRVGGELARADAMVTLTGVEGGPVYALSRPIREQLDRDGRCVLEVDLHPDQTVEQLTIRLSRRRPKDSVANWLRRSIGLTPVSIGLLREATHNRVPTEPGEVAGLVKSVPVAVSGTMPIDRAISTAGGVALDEVDESLMLRRVPGTFVAGEMLDWEAPTGGYLLQASFTTGVVAARGALLWMGRAPRARGRLA